MGITVGKGVGIGVANTVTGFTGMGGNAAVTGITGTGVGLGNS